MLRSNVGELQAPPRRKRTNNPSKQLRIDLLFFASFHSRCGDPRLN